MVTQLKTSDQRKVKGQRQFPLTRQVPILISTKMDPPRMLQAHLLNLTNRIVTWIQVLFGWL